MSNFLRIFFYTILFVILGIFFGYFTFKMLSFSRTVEVPDLYGKNIVEVNKILSDRGLYLKIEGEDFDSTIPPGNVIKQDIPAGKKIKEKRSIKVIISKGPKIKSIPSLLNETLYDVDSILLQKGLRIGKLIMVHSDLIEKDRVIAQSPAPDEPIKDVITLVVSLGPYEKEYICPDFRGMSLEQAEELIMRLKVKYVIKGTMGIVQSQKPAPGTRLKKDDIISLEVY